MPFLTVDNVRIFYRLEGDAHQPVLVFSHSIGTDHGMWDMQVPDLLPHFRILRYDTRGHGASDVPPGEYSMERLGRDVLGLADALGITRFAFCGLSLGGMIGQWIGVNAPDRLNALVLANTSPLMLPKSNWDARRTAVLGGGMAAIADTVMQRFFSLETSAASTFHVNSVRNTLLGTDPTGYAGCCSAIRDMDHRGLLSKITVPTLVIVGDRDVSTPWVGHGEILAREIPGARAVHLPAPHLSNIERPRAFSVALVDFLLPQSAKPRDAGEAVRRAVLGDEHVDRAVASTTDFTREFQELITQYAWGTVWTRPGLDLRTRRLLVLAMLATQGCWEEFRMHVRTGLERNLEPCDVKEVLLAVTIYAGVPAANTAFSIVDEEIEKIRHVG